MEDDEDDIYVVEHGRQPNEAETVPLPVPTPGMRLPSIEAGPVAAPPSLNPVLDYPANERGRSSWTWRCARVYCRATNNGG